MPDSTDVVLHVSTHPDDVPRAIGSARLLAAEGWTVRIIVNGPALGGLLTDAAALPAVAGVSIAACETGMRGRGIQAENLAPGTGTVPSAVVALAQAQRAGAAYIRV